MGIVAVLLVGASNAATPVTVSTLAGGGVVGFSDGVGAAARLSAPRGVVINSADTFALVVSAFEAGGLASPRPTWLALQADTNNNAIRRVGISAGDVSTFAGSPSGVLGLSDGVGTGAKFNGPRGIAMDAANTFALVVS